MSNPPQLEIHLKNRRDQIIYTRLRTGHSRLTHEHLISKNTPTTCNYCQTTMNIKHIWECKHTENLRKRFGILKAMRKTLNNKTNTVNVIKFINDIGPRKLL